MCVVVGRHRAQHADLICQLGGQRHQLAYLQSRRGGRNRFEVAADLGRRVRLGIPGFMLEINQ